MIRWKIEKTKGMFFDPDAVLEPAEKAKRSRLSMFGAFVRRTAKGLIRPGKKPSKPGQPPKSHVGTLKNFLYFAYDTLFRGVVVGPAKTNQVFFTRDGQPVSGTVPSVLEHGGSITIEEAQNPRTGRWRRRDMRFRRAGTQAEWKRRRRTIEIAERPYMAPALEKNEDKFPDLWEGAITPRVQ